MADYSDAYGADPVSQKSFGDAVRERRYMSHAGDRERETLEKHPDEVISYEKNDAGRWQTKDSGKRAEFESGMVRDTEEGKPRFDLIMPLGIPYDEQLLTRFADLMARGAEKYDERNWEQASTQKELDRYLSSALRHFMQWYHGETDEDHAAAVLFNITAAEAVKRKLEHGKEKG